MAKDFFDEEYEKQTTQSNGGDSWFSRPAPKQEQPKPKRPLYIAGIAFGLVLCIALGWVLCTVFQGIIFTYNTDGSGAASYGGDILETVIKYLKTNYYKDVEDEAWLDAIEYSGTALLQKAGDRYSQLMSPQTYYDFLYPTGASGSTSDEIFGVSFVVEEGVGLYVSSVVANSGAYGKLQSGDIILKLTEMKDADGNAPVIKSGDENITFDSMVVGQWSSTAIQKVLSATKKANFHVLRLNSDSEDGLELFSVELTRQAIKQVVSDYQYNFIEFYFNDQYSNISLPSKKDINGKYIIDDNDDDYSTYEERRLDQLPYGTGYVRIDQFMDYTKLEGGKNVTVSASQEFVEVMGLFKKLGLKRLVLDLKGNPGGNVAYVCDIAAMLVTDDKLTAEQKLAVNNDGDLLITTLTMTKLNYMQTYSRSSLYHEYFGNIGAKCDIVVWTDGGSASASELLTGALTDYGTAVQMGVTTYGKGIAQTWNELPFYGTVTNLNGEKETFPWAIYYTVASYYSPFGTNIHGIGYTPRNPYNNLTTYAELWQAANSYWN